MIKNWNWKVKLVWYLWPPEINEQVKQGESSLQASVKGKDGRVESYENEICYKNQASENYFVGMNSLIKRWRRMKLKGTWIQNPDITERNRSERALIKSSQWSFHLLAEINTNCMVHYSGMNICTTNNGSMPGSTEEVT
jgi:hypothetical protein